MKLNTYLELELKGKKVMAPFVETAYQLQEARINGNVGRSFGLLFKQATFFVTLIITSVILLVALPFVGTYRNLKVKYD